MPADHSVKPIFAPTTYLLIARALRDIGDGFVADAFVSTSQHEGFGLVFLEAMAAGLPIVCYDRGGQTDFLASGETGFVVALNDVIAFGHAVRAIHADIYLRRRLGQRNRQLVENYFIDSCAARYEKVFEAAIGRRLAAQRGVAPTSH